MSRHVHRLAVGSASLLLIIAVLLLPACFGGDSSTNTGMSCNFGPGLTQEECHGIASSHGCALPPPQVVVNCLANNCSRCD